MFNLTDSVFHKSYFVELDTFHKGGLFCVALLPVFVNPGGIFAKAQPLLGFYLLFPIFCSALQICFVFRGPFAPPISFSFEAQCKLAFFRAYAARTCPLFLLVQKEGKDTPRGRRSDSPSPLETPSPPAKKGAAAPSLGFSPGEYEEYCSARSGAFYKTCFVLQ